MILKYEPFSEPLGGGAQAGRSGVPGARGGACRGGRRASARGGCADGGGARGARGGGNPESRNLKPETRNPNPETNKKLPCDN